MKIVRVQNSNIRKLWPHVAPHLKKAVLLSPQKIAMADVLDEAETGGYGLWAIVDETNKNIVAACTTRVAIYPRTRALAIDFLGGTKMKEWIEDLDTTMTAHAKELDCSFIEGFGVRAWGRVLKDYGWKAAYTTYEKELTDGHG